MDFNTGGSGGQNPNDPARPLYGSGPAGPAPGLSGGPTGEFNMSNPVGSFVSTVRALVSNPVGFFRSLPRSGGFVNPLAFAAICSLIAAIPFGLLFVLFSLFAADASFFLTAVLLSLLYLVLFPAVTVLSDVVGAAIYHLVVYLLVRQNNAGFGATLRVVCYASFPVILAFLFLIPILNILIGLVLTVYVIILFVLGIREVHGMTTGQAAIVILAPVAVSVVLSLVFGLLAIVIGALAGSA